MRGEAERQATMMLVLAPEGFGWEGPPVVADQAAGRLGDGTDVAPVRRDVRDWRATFDPARAPVQVESLDRILYGSL